MAVRAGTSIGLAHLLCFVPPAKACSHRHLRNIDRLMANTTCLVCLISTVSGRSNKKAKNALEDVTLVGVRVN